MNSIDKAIRQNESILEKNILNNDSFESLSSANTDFSSDCLKFHTVFTNAIILICLSESKTSVSDTISRKLFSFLKKQKGDLCTFNYWDKNSKEYSKIPYPDDLDDTFCALLAMYKFNKLSISGNDLKKILEVLISQEVETGGPYYTWLVDQNDVEWKDIDLAVNSNIANFLTEFGIELQNITSFIDESINNNSIKSRYYPTSTPVAYFISRSYKGQSKKKLKNTLETLYSRESSTLLDRIIISSSLLRLNLFQHELVARTIETLLDANINTSNAFPFYRGVNPFLNGKKYYAGSENLTAALTIEFLTLYKKKAIEIGASHTKASLEKQNRIVCNDVSLELQQAHGIIAEYGAERLDTLLKNPDMAFITCIPYIIYRSFKTPIKIENFILADIAKATLFGWLAYDIYDDFFDNQSIPYHLSVANFSLRKLSTTFTSDYLSKEFHSFFHETMNIVDNANASEAKMPIIKVKNNALILDDKIIPIIRSNASPENKSIGHILPIVAIYSLVGYSPQHNKTLTAINFFKNYLAARQLIDDMHDWEEDLKLGKINTVAFQIINEALKKQKKKVTINYLRSLFWEVTVIKSCKRVYKHIDQAEKTGMPFLEILEPLKIAIDSTIKERQIALDFLL